MIRTSINVSVDRAYTFSSAGMATGDVESSLKGLLQGETRLCGGSLLGLAAVRMLDSQDF